jgi:hypothetical protein
MAKKRKSYMKTGHVGDTWAAQLWHSARKATVKARYGKIKEKRRYDWGRLMSGKVGIN